MRRCVFIPMLFLVSCSPIRSSVEFYKQVWGSSTQSLEKARANAIVKIYKAAYWDVVKGATEIFKAENYVIFKADEVKGYVVLMGIKNAVNTTEVGVFFVEESADQTRVEISSLSTSAKRIVSKNLFHELDIRFGLIPPDLKTKENFK